MTSPATIASRCARCIVHIQSPPPYPVASLKTDFSGEEHPSRKKFFQGALRLRCCIKAGAPRRLPPLPTSFNEAPAGPHDRINDGRHAAAPGRSPNRNAANRLRKPICANRVSPWMHAAHTGVRVPDDAEARRFLVPMNRRTSPDRRFRGTDTPPIFRPIEKNPHRSNLLAAQSLLYLSHQFTLLFRRGVKYSWPRRKQQRRSRQKRQPQRRRSSCALRRRRSRRLLAFLTPPAHVQPRLQAIRLRVRIRFRCSFAAPLSSTRFVPTPSVTLPTSSLPSHLRQTPPGRIGIPRPDRLTSGDHLNHMNRNGRHGSADETDGGSGLTSVKRLLIR